jgi:hypothetical protein
MTLQNSSAETGLILQQSQQLGPTVIWNDTTNLVLTVGPTNVVQQTTSGIATRFHRLRRP